MLFCVLFLLFIVLEAQNNSDCIFSVTTIYNELHILNLTLLNGKAIAFSYFDSEGYQTDYIYTPCANNICCPYEDSLNTSTFGYFMFAEATDCYHSGCIGLWDDYNTEPQYSNKVGSATFTFNYKNPLCRSSWPNNRSTDLEIVFECHQFAENILYETSIKPGNPFQAKIKSPLACH